MNKVLFSVFIVVLFFLNGCAAKRNTGPRIPMRPLSQEEVDAIRAQAAIENVEQQEIWKWQLNLECPNGGREDVIIDENLGKNAFRVGGGKVRRFLLARYMGLVKTVNLYNEVVHIDEGGRPMVRNMCPNGSITLVAVLGWEAGIIGAGYHSGEEFVWTAQRFVDGHLYHGTSERLDLYVYQWHKEKKVQWIMEVDDIDRKLPAHPRLE